MKKIRMKQYNVEKIKKGNRRIKKCKKRKLALHIYYTTKNLRRIIRRRIKNMYDEWLKEYEKIKEGD